MGGVEEKTARESLYRDGQDWNKHGYALPAHECQTGRRSSGETGTAGEPGL